MLGHEAKRIRLLGEATVTNRFSAITQAAQNLIKETPIKMTLDEFCRFCPQFCAAITRAITGTIPKRQAKSLLTDVGAPRVIGMVEGVPTAIILNGGSFKNIVTKDFLEHLGITDIAPSEMRYILADGRQAPCIGTVQGIQVTIHGVSQVIEATVFGHSQFNLLLGRKTMRNFHITTHYGTDVAYSKEIDMDCTSFNLDPFSEAFLAVDVSRNIELNQSLSKVQKTRLSKLMDQFEFCIVENMDQLPLATKFKHCIVTKKRGIHTGENCSHAFLGTYCSQYLSLGVSHCGSSQKEWKSAPLRKLYTLECSDRKPTASITEGKGNPSTVQRRKLVFQH
ncbi:hypothetical protein DSO57_1012842 [Entomophthora muscae]|uniref:Uncharacterized protein n=1 Tax=Entomophthora muscae TaxID=34485 RepID=A0ACC2S7K8_9FUNG|nr:hypothetical protein DSO57_1012842 [Entomophthora muscae]